jgi:hypothetical protein
MKLALLLLTPLLLIGVIDWQTLQLEQKAQKLSIREEIAEPPSFHISKKDIEAQRLKYEANMEALYRQAKASPEKWL